MICLVAVATGPIALAGHFAKWDKGEAVHVNDHKVGADGEWSTVEQYDVAKHF